MRTSLMFWNLYEASRELDRGDPTRWHQQVAVVRRHRPDILAVTEGWLWDQGDAALFHRAREEFGFDTGALYASKTGCHMALFWNAPITAVARYQQPHDQAWWHGFHRVQLQIPGHTEPFEVLGTHLNPFDPTLRRIEGSWIRQGLPAHRHGMVVMDANCVAPGDPEPERSPASHFPGEDDADRLPLETLAAAGLIDVGAAFDDRRPTAGHFGAGTDGAVGRSVRIDQAWATPSVSLAAYRPLLDTAADPELDTASDHRPLWIEFDGS